MRAEEQKIKDTDFDAEQYRLCISINVIMKAVNPELQRSCTRWQCHPNVFLICRHVAYVD
jgi:hypothetical protein